MIHGYTEYVTPDGETDRVLSPFDLPAEINQLFARRDRERDAYRRGQAVPFRASEEQAQAWARAEHELIEALLARMTSEETESA